MTMLRSIFVAAAGIAVASSIPLNVQSSNEYVSKIQSILDGLPAEYLNQSSSAMPHRRQAEIKHQKECSGRPSADVPRSIHQLRPGDVRVVGAIGDSITAGFGELANNLFELMNEYRGSSWCIGGDEDFSTLTTVPNILKLFGSPAIGASIGKNNARNPNAGERNNVAVTGAIAEGMRAQAERLVRKMKDDRDITYEEDWKVVTLWIGGNDLCAVCNNNEPNQPQPYADYIEEALDFLLAEMPRVYINLVSILDITQLAEVDQGLCKIINRAVCSCATSSDPEVLARVERDAREMQRLTAIVAAKDKYHQSSDFTVELQPFMIDAKVPRGPDGKPDLNFFAPDCFHFSKIGHEAIATGLWNNMMQAPENKQTVFVLGEELECPTNDRPFLCTLTNNCGATSRQPHT